jgi:hypothetical protein
LIDLTPNGGRQVTEARSVRILTRRVDLEAPMAAAHLAALIVLRGQRRTEHPLPEWIGRQERVRRGV